MADRKGYWEELQNAKAIRRALAEGWGKTVHAVLVTVEKKAKSLGKKAPWSVIQAVASFRRMDKAGMGSRDLNSILASIYKAIPKDEVVTRGQGKSKTASKKPVKKSPRKSKPQLVPEKTAA